jgi:protein TonB
MRRNAAPVSSGRDADTPRFATPIPEVHVFTTLLASNAPTVRTPGSTAASLALHAAMITAAVWLTAQRVNANPVPTDVHIAYVPQAPPQPPVPSPASAHPTPLTPPTVPVISVPVTVPTTLPAIAATPMPVTDATVFSVGPASLGAQGAHAGATPIGSGDVAYDGVSVDTPVVPLAGSPPRYPALLKDAGVEGRVDVRFVVDTLGRVERTSVEVIDATHALFVEAVRAALLRQRFIPAEVAGRRVRQLVTQPFLFTIQR